MTQPTVQVNVSATIRGGAVEVELSPGYVTVTQLGERGGRGASFRLRIAEWDQIVAGVTRVRRAFDVAEEAARAAAEDALEQSDG